ncbi:hypothetical protein A9Q94_18805 [Rhodobacterales bacterium 56_14_T64]|nr:hypothetical protein A9Q94_18805 [Rhodobacterales bacterium 56_14_T64]
MIFPLHPTARQSDRSLTDNAKRRSPASVSGLRGYSADVRAGGLWIGTDKPAGSASTVLCQQIYQANIFQRGVGNEALEFGVLILQILQPMDI